MSARDDSSADTPGHPDRIGPYRILEPLGEGGMAVVYLAEQHEPVQRRVALKMIKLGMDTREVVRRFESERQTLAVLNHPNIAQVYDGGATVEGRPYFVMEYVDGEPIGRYCAAQRLTVRERLKLLVDVCAAVQHAHLKGLIHRDLKPSNLLVVSQESAPLPKVIDFGIAKAVSAEDDPATMLTRLGQAVGTPHYMSPEQFAGRDVDSRTDIYSLGVLLYELLAGVRPFELDGVPEHALGYRVSRQAVATPSARLGQLEDTREDVAAERRTDFHGLRRTLRGDLDLIVMKAMARDRDERYPTANALATDLQRYLDDEPILARRPSTGYQLRRFARRNRVAVAAAGVAALALLSGTVLATVGMLRARDAGETARQEAEKAREVSSFLVELFEVSNPSESLGNTITAREVLDTAASRIGEELDERPAVKAAMMATMSEVYKNLGLYAEALPLAESALAMRRALSADPEEIADSLDQLGDLRRKTGQFETAGELHLEALAVRRRHPQSVPRFVRTLEHLAETHFVLGEYDKSAALFEEALSLVADREDEHALLIAEISSNLGAVKHSAGDFERSEPYHRRAIALYRRELDGAHPDMATAANNLAAMLKAQGRLEEAEPLYREALAGYETVFPDAHPLTANATNNLAMLLYRKGEHEEAIELLGEALAMYRDLVGNEHPQIATVTNNLGSVLASAGRYDDALRVQREALALRERILPQGHRSFASSHESIAITLTGMRRYREAEDAARSAIGMHGAALGEDHWRVARARGTLGAALAGLERYAEAEPLLLESYESMAKKFELDSETMILARGRLRELYEAWDKPELARRFAPGQEGGEQQTANRDGGI